MIKYFINKYSDKVLSGGTVLLFDMLTCAVTFLMAYVIRYNFNISVIDFDKVFIQMGIVLLVNLNFFLYIRSYSGIIRHTGLMDVYRIGKALLFSLLLLLGLHILFASSGKYDDYLISFSVLIINFLLSLFFLIGGRALIKLIFVQITRQYVKERIPVLIYGAGDAGMLTKNALIKDKTYNYEVVAYIDDNTSKVNKQVEGIPVVSQHYALSLPFIKKYKIKQLIIAIEKIKPTKRKEIVEAGLALHLDVKVVPSTEVWINGQLSTKQLRRVKIEDLLERDTIELDSKNVYREIKNKVVMVTGGAGSIGSEIARQILTYSPKRLIILDQAESPIYDLQFEIRNTKKFKDQLNKVEFVIASVKDKFRMNKVFDIYRPDIIYHAAAYKHVPLMEDNPYEALMVNIFGSKNIADLSIKYKAEKFVMISTDKAVNPTNIMGATKRIAEMYIQSLSTTTTKFVTTRFGNVLGSNGSVVPLFRKQIEAGGPVTVTHKDITRYFMTIPEACNLVMEAGAMGEGADIFVFDMGEPVKIYHMARKMISLFGFEPDVDIKIIETGLRPGEKLYEELLSNKENTLPTHHPKIMRAKVRRVSNMEMNDFFNEISEKIVDGDQFAIVSKMKSIVPEFISNNSIFAQLDKKKNE